MDFEKTYGRGGLMITAAWILSNWDDWPTNVKTIIQRDIEEEFERDARMPELKVLGDDCDKREWEKVRELWRN